MKVSDEIVFVAEDQQGFSIFNHISGTRLCLVDSVDGRHFENIPNITGVLNEDLLFVYDTYSTNKIYVYDISDLLNPLNVHYFPGDTANLKRMLAVPNSDEGADLFWSSSFELKHVTYNDGWTVHTPYEFPNEIRGFDISDEYIIVAGLQLGFYIIERSSGNLICSLETPGEALDVKIVDNLVILALREEGFKIFDISNPIAPQEIFSKDFNDLIYTVDAENDKMVLSSRSGGVFLYDISDISNPEYLGNIDSGDIGYTFDAALHDGKIFAATRLGIQVISF